MKNLYVSLLLFATSLSCNKKEQEATASETENKSRTVPVKTTELTVGDYSEYGEFLGEISGSEQATLIAYPGGRVHKVNAIEGDVVKKGQNLCDIEAEVYQVKWKAAILAQDIAKKKHERTQIHLKKGIVSQMQASQSESSYLQAKGQLLEAKKIRDGAYCTAPISGTVVERLIEPHQVLSPNSPTFVIANTKKIKITAGIPENEISGYQNGNEVAIYLSAYPNKVWKGKVSRIAESVNNVNRTFSVVAEAENSENLLKPGLTARIKILRQKVTEAIVIPTNVIQTIGTKQFVFIASNGKASRKQIQILLGDQEQTVISDGLEVGQTLITEGFLNASDGSPIKIIKDK